VPAKHTNWVTEAERFHQIPEEILYINNAIRAFLEGDRIFFLIASKGMGKTLLLRCKRKRLEAEKQLTLDRWEFDEHCSWLPHRDIARQRQSTGDGWKSQRAPEQC
jgi:hypothetical protein